MPSYRCQHCHRTLSVTGDYVEVCQCPESVQEAQSLKERNKQLAHQEQISFAEARMKNKRPLRNTTSDAKERLSSIVQQVGIYAVLSWLSEIVRDNAQSWTGARKKLAEDLANSIERTRDR